MPESMPYHLETGRALQRIEQFLNNTVSKNAAGVVGGPLSVHGHRVHLKQVADDLGAMSVVDVLNKHTDLEASRPGILAELQFKWFGDPVTGFPGPAAPAGSFLKYRGHPEKILRQALIRAIDLSLSSPVASRPYPFLLMWKCAQPWFETWVQWRTDPGVVALVVCTPADGSHIMMSPLKYQPGAPTPADYVVNPAALGAFPRGSLVVTHRAHQELTMPVFDTYQRQLAQPGVVDGAPVPSFGGVFAASGDLVVGVMPAMIDGGARE